MGEVITIRPRNVRSRPLRPGYRPTKRQILRYCFREDYNTLGLLQDTPLQEYSLPTAEPILFYPGCGHDILFPLFYVETLFPILRKMTIILNDTMDVARGIRTILADLEAPVQGTDERWEFYWGELLVSCVFVKGDVFTLLDQIPAFDIYFERAFRIMKDRASGYEQDIYARLKAGGMLISDSGFQQFPLEKLTVDQKLSAYGEMVVGIKKEKNEPPRKLTFPSR